MLLRMVWYNIAQGAGKQGAGGAGGIALCSQRCLCLRMVTRSKDGASKAPPRSPQRTYDVATYLHRCV